MRFEWFDYKLRERERKRDRERKSDEVTKGRCVDEEDSQA